MKLILNRRLTCSSTTNPSVHQCFWRCYVSSQYKHHDAVMLSFMNVIFLRFLQIMWFLPLRTSISTVHWEQRSKYREVTVLPKTPALSQCRCPLKMFYQALQLTLANVVSINHLKTLWKSIWFCTDNQNHKLSTHYCIQLEMYNLHI